MVEFAGFCVQGSGASVKLASQSPVQGMATMYKAIAGPAAAAVFASVPALQAHASEEAGVVATIQQYNDDFNNGDSKSAAALCTPHTIIIDDFTPHAWQGATTC